MPAALLRRLNAAYLDLHERYERLYWRVHMGAHGLGSELVEARAALDAFRSDPAHSADLEGAIALSGPSGNAPRRALGAWKKYFSLYRFSPKALELKRRIGELEADVNGRQSAYSDAYSDPETGERVECSVNRLALTVRTHPDERVRKSAHEAMERYAATWAEPLAELVALRNEFARECGFAHYYDYQAIRNEGVPAEKIFSIFADVTERLLPTYRDIDAADASPGIRAPWNLTHRFSKRSDAETDPYFPLETAIDRWTRSYSEMGVDFSGGSLVLDLFDRPGKHRGGFCHWPVPAYHVDGERVSGEAEFTCVAIPGALGSGLEAFLTLFHEGGHAAHYLACEHPAAVYATEYAPASVAWAETQSMFFEGIIDSLAWRARYARTRDGEWYSVRLHAKLLEDSAPMRAYDMLRIASMVEFERSLYTAATPLRATDVLALARDVSTRYFPFDRPVDSLLAIPHIYDSESSCYYHGYGLALMGVAMFDEFFLTRDGHRADNARVGPTLRDGWRLGSEIAFFDGVRRITGRDFSPDAYVERLLATPADRLAHEMRELAVLESVPSGKGVSDLQASIRIEDGPTVIAEAKSSRGYAALDRAYRAEVARRMGA